MGSLFFHTSCGISFFSFQYVSVTYQFYGPNRTKLKQLHPTPLPFNYFNASIFFITRFQIYLNTLLKLPFAHSEIFLRISPNWTISSETRNTADLPFQWTVQKKPFYSQANKYRKVKIQRNRKAKKSTPRSIHTTFVRHNQDTTDKACYPNPSIYKTKNHQTPKSTKISTPYSILQSPNPTSLFFIHHNHPFSSCA